MDDGFIGDGVDYSGKMTMNSCSSPREQWCVSTDDSSDPPERESIFSIF